MEDPVVQAAEEIFEKVEDVLPEVRCPAINGEEVLVISMCN